MTGSTSLEDLRALPFEAVNGANVLQVGLDSLFGQFTYGPTVDESIVPDLPGRLLAQGRFDKTVDILTGYNIDEGLTFTNPFVSNDDELTAYLRQALPRASDEVLETIQAELYPPVFDGSFGYKDEIKRLATIVADSGFVCNTRYLQEAFGGVGDGVSYGYVFAVPPGLHGQDVVYTYFTGAEVAEGSEGTAGTDSDGNDDASAESTDAAADAAADADAEVEPDAFNVVRDVGVARELQRYVVTFAETGTPVGEEIPDFPVYGRAEDGTEVVVLDPRGIVTAQDAAAGERCAFWQAAPYF